MAPAGASQQGLQEGLLLVESSEMESRECPRPWGHSGGLGDGGSPGQGWEVIGADESKGAAGQGGQGWAPGYSVTECLPYSPPGPGQTFKDARPSQGTSAPPSCTGALSWGWWWSKDHPTQGLRYTPPANPQGPFHTSIPHMQWVTALSPPLIQRLSHPGVGLPPTPSLPSMSMLLPPSLPPTSTPYLSK